MMVVSGCVGLCVIVSDGGLFVNVELQLQDGVEHVEPRKDRGVELFPKRRVELGVELVAELVGERESDGVPDTEAAHQDGPSRISRTVSAQAMHAPWSARRSPTYRPISGRSHGWCPSGWIRLVTARATVAGFSPDPSPTRISRAVAHWWCRFPLAVTAAVQRFAAGFDGGCVPAGNDAAVAVE